MSKRDQGVRVLHLHFLRTIHVQTYTHTQTYVHTHTYTHEHMKAQRQLTELNVQIPLRHKSETMQIARTRGRTRHARADSLIYRHTWAPLIQYQSLRRYRHLIATRNCTFQNCANAQSSLLLLFDVNYNTSYNVTLIWYFTLRLCFRR